MKHLTHVWTQLSYFFLKSWHFFDFQERAEKVQIKPLLLEYRFVIHSTCSVLTWLISGSGGCYFWNLYAYKNWIDKNFQDSTMQKIIILLFLYSKSAIAFAKTRFSFSQSLNGSNVAPTSTILKLLEFWRLFRSIKFSPRNNLWHLSWVDCDYTWVTMWMLV